MHGRVSRKPLKLPAHVDKILYLRIVLVERPEIVARAKRIVYGDDGLVRQPVGNYLGNRVRLGIRDIKRPSHILDNALRKHLAEGYYLHDAVFSVFLHYIVDDLGSALVAEIYVDIGHGYTFRV